MRSPPSMQVRPTSDRLRETLFNILAPRIEEARFLDLCAGSGAVGIEALSRGAAFVTFVDRSRKMCGLVESNLDLCGVPEDETEVVQAEAAEYLRRVQSKGAPYAIDYAPALHLFGTGEFLDADNGLLIVEHHHKKELLDEVGILRRWRTLKQGDSCLSFYEGK